MSSPALLLADEMESTFQWRIDTDPEFAASIGLLSKRRSKHALDPRSLASFEQRLSWIDRALERAKAITITGAPSSQYPSQRATEKENEEPLLLNYELYVEQLSDYSNYTRHHQAYLCCINRLEGPQTDLPLYARYLQPLCVTKKGQQFYLAFLTAIPVQLTEIQELLTYGVQQGRTPPQISLSGVVPQIRNMIQPPENEITPATSGTSTNGLQQAFLPPISSSLSSPPQKDKHNKNKDENETTFYQECVRLVNGPVRDAFDRLGTYLEQDYIPNLRTEISATKGYPDGKQYYIDCLKFHTTTNMTPEEIHQLGLDQVKRVRNEMKKIAAVDDHITSDTVVGTATIITSETNGCDSGENNDNNNTQLDKYLEYLRTNTDFEPESTEALLANYRNIIGNIYPALLTLFNISTLPRQPLQIVETPAASASMAPAAYYLAGSNEPSAPRPGMFYVNTSELKTRRTYECEALALHEAIPGHHMQSAIQGEATLPEYRRYCEDRRYFEAPCRFPFYTAYIEGWGLHCETLGKELGVYNQPTDTFGQLSMEAIRCCRLVVDTGMHALNWSYEDAVKYMLQNTAMGEHDAKTECARYITWPGQATAYKVGEQRIRKLRSRAETQLLRTEEEETSLFDPREFYDTILLCGAVPLDVLERRVEEYIHRTIQQNAPPSSIEQEEKGRNNQSGATTTTEKEKQANAIDNDFIQTMTFANWCKCCIVPGACQP